MTRASTVVQMLIRACFVVQLVLGGLFWINNARGLVPLHQLVGFILVIAIWTQAGLAARAGVSLGLVAFTVVWALVVPILGLSQTELLPGSAHWVIQVVHLLVGIIAVGLAERLATGIRGRTLARS
ncbi:MAG TPA: hypothetical protein VNK73_12460 [Actinomycetota bacterium]|jgi:hypothetical protein|nr:hypothetical protein [Actinomycetota bacterium]